jgi:SAM-dependent methyltransferase
LKGPIEDQALAPGSLDVIALMDVLEHLRDPMGTMRHCLDRLAPGGLLLIQTPCYSAGSTYEEMAGRAAQPLEILQPGEHLYLFSERSIVEMFRRLGAPHVAFEPALFADYDMFCVVSREPIGPRVLEEQPLAATPGARLVQALLDAHESERRAVAAVGAIEAQVAAAEADRAARLRVIERQGRDLGEVEAERNILRTQVDELRGHMAGVEADRAARLAFMEEQGRRLGEIEGERNRLRAQVETVRSQLDDAEADRAARLGVIQQQGRRIEAAEAEIAVQAEQMQIVLAQMRALQRVLHAIVHSRLGLVMRRLGRWRFIDTVETPPPKPE